MTTKNALSAIDTLRLGWYDPPTLYRSNTLFKYQSFRASGLNEIIKYLKERMDKNPISSIEEFRNMMGDFACGGSDSANFMFSVYYDTATDVLDMLLNIK